MNRSWTLTLRPSRMAGLIFFISSVPYLSFAQPQGDQRNLIPEVRIDQSAINAGSVPFATIFNAGKHIFSNRFSSLDHYGEAPDGPRRRLQTIAGRPNLPYLRFNGLDAQSCMGCHNTSGFESAAASNSEMRFMKEPGVTGGGAGSASNAYGWADFPFSTEGFVRNPPHAFGMGYLQRVAAEMSEDLFRQRDEAIEAAVLSGAPVTRAITTKGVSFGSIAALPTGELSPVQAELEGVGADLIVRPLQFSGLASTVRNFVAGALNFHFSVQPKELLDQGVVPDDNPTGRLTHDVRNEILEGEVSALSTFVAFMRPPTESEAGLDSTAVARGRQLFVDTDCAVCHRPTLRISDPRVTIIDPRPELERLATRAALGVKDPPTPERPTLTVTAKHGEDLAVARQYAAHEIARKSAGGLETVAAAGAVLDRLPGFTRSLNLSDGPEDSLPRLPARVDGRIDVPLYSDLKRHKMGAGLAESFAQGADAPGILVPGEEWLTRPLWGVADTGPWLHDGRALTLHEAIVMHAGQGSEANDSIGQYDALTLEERRAIITFLRSLRLPAAGARPVNAALRWEGYGQRPGK